MFHDGDGIKIHDLGLESGILGKIGIEGSLTPMIHLESSTYTVEFLDNKYGFSLFSRLLPIWFNDIIIGKTYHKIDNI